MLLAAESGEPTSPAPVVPSVPAPVKKKRTLHPAMVAHQFKKKGA